jgi:hypothetical protein
MKATIIFLLMLSSCIPGSMSLPVTPEIHEFSLPGPPPDLTGLNLNPNNSTGPVTSWGELVCETSNASPLVSHSKVVIERLKKSKKRCIQSNGVGSVCTQFESYKSAQAGMCGYLFWSVRCKELGWALEQIVNKCESNGRAGGEWHFGDPLIGILY